MSEREEFEAQVLSKYPNQDMGRFSDGEYQSVMVQHCWEFWQARAARTAPVEPVAWVTQCRNSGLIEQCEPNEKASNPDWTDAFPVYTAPDALQAVGTTSDKYRAELYDEVWQKARDMGYGNVTDALVDVDRLKQFEAAYMEWSDKTDWVQESAEVRELGKHRADVMRERIERLQEEKDSAIRILARQIDKFHAALIERDAFKADAERYQYLKYILDDSPYYIQLLEHIEGDLLDEAIDNSRREHPDFKPEVDHE